MIYYKSKYLSLKLRINIAKWKRWSRDFLPPDPLGGLQSGVARQFNLRDVFKIYFGGYLVSELKFTIPEAVRILAELSPWFKKNGFYELQSKVGVAPDQNISKALIYIYEDAAQQFTYSIRSILSETQPGPDGLNQETFNLTLIGTGVDPLATGQSDSATVIAIDTLYNDLLRRIA